MFLGTASKADHEAAGEAEVSDHAWQVPKERVDALVLSVTLADSQHFHEALWELTRTAMTNRYVCTRLRTLLQLCVMHNSHRALL